MTIARGTTRTVFVGRRYAVKVAGSTLAVHGRWWLLWQSLLRGLMANLQERQWSGLRQADGRLDDRLCPVLWGDPLGLVVVMPRAEPMTPCSPLWLAAHDRQERFTGLPLDPAARNFGVLDGRVVLLDYGS